jgi:lipopolysaccharide/colanic/teichoic acid biosynthesis glycosyltransferase
MPFWKRILDLAFCLVALPVLAVATLVMTIVHQIASPGPVFFLQDRIGLKGKVFRIYKFRTMTAGADTTAHRAYLAQVINSKAPMIKLDARGDSRVIPGGWLLRATGLDELPQIINVLRGEMSLVGPRPCVPYEYEQYQAWQRRRFDATPGLTGLWQVSGKNRTTFNEMVQFDIEYLETRSLYLDLKIIFITLPALLAQVQETRQLRRASLARDEAPAIALRSRASSTVLYSKDLS